MVAETGVLAGKTRRALDSTVLDDAVATQDTVTQLIAAIRRVAREVPGAAAVIAEHCRAHDYSRPGKPAIAWDDQAARDELVDALVGDAHRLLGHLPEQELDPKAAEAVALLALVAGQDVEPAEGSDGTDGRWRIARRVAPDRVISTVDPEARHAHKTRSRRQDGYKAHVVVEPDTGIITDTALTPAAGADNSDATVGVDLLLDQRRAQHRPARPDQPGPATEPGRVGGAGRFGLRHRGRAGRAHRRRAHPDHQALAAAPGRRGRVHPRRLHRRRTHRRPARLGDLPERAHPPDHRHPHGDLRGAVSRLPAARPLHHQQDRPLAAPAPPRRDHPRAPPTRPRSRSSRPPTAGTGPWSNARSPG